MSQQNGTSIHLPYIRIVLWDMPGGVEKLPKQLLRKIKEAVGKATAMDPEDILIQHSRSLSSHRRNLDTTLLGVEIVWNIDRSQYAHKTAQEAAVLVLKKELPSVEVILYPESPPPKSLAEHLEDCLRSGLRWICSPFTITVHILSRT